MGSREENKQNKEYRYPDFLVFLYRAKKINTSMTRPIYVSVLRAKDGHDYYDIRVWTEDNTPTGKGVFFPVAVSMNLIDTLDRILSGEEL